MCGSTTREEDTKRETDNRIKMNYLTCGLINGPLVILNIVANAFYIFCLVRPLHRERIKQPLKLLLGSLICCAVTYMVSVSVMLFSGRLVGKLTEINQLMFEWSLSGSMSSSVWLTFVYCTQIVPAQRALFIWIKKNIKPIIYCIWLVERIGSLFDFTVLLNSVDGFGFSKNFTGDHDILLPLRVSSKWQADPYMIVIFIHKTHLFICLCVMVMSSCSTVVYLGRHIRRMITNGQPPSCPRLRGQVRVTIMGILQGVLFVFCYAMWAAYQFAPQISSKNSSNAILTSISLYISGTTFSLGAGQSVFRQRLEDIWLRAAQCCKAPNVQQSEQGG